MSQDAQQTERITDFIPREFLTKAKCEGGVKRTVTETVVSGACHQEVTQDLVMARQIMVSDCQSVAIY